MCYFDHNNRDKEIHGPKSKDNYDIEDHFYIFYFSVIIRDLVIAGECWKKKFKKKIILLSAINPSDE